MRTFLKFQWRLLVGFLMATVLFLFLLLSQVVSYLLCMLLGTVMLNYTTTILIFSISFSKVSVFVHYYFIVIEQKFKVISLQSGTKIGTKLFNFICTVIKLF